VLGLRANTALFVVLLLAPAVVLAWLGFAAAVPLERELARSAQADVVRAVAAAAAALPVRVDAVLERARSELAAAAHELAATLPVEGPAAFAALEQRTGWCLLVRDAAGATLLPAPPRDLALPFLDEWPGFLAFARDAHAGIAGSERARAFVAPALRARALALLADDDGAVAGELAPLTDAELAAAGPRAVERLLVGAAGRARIAASPALLLATPAPAAARERWMHAVRADEAATREGLRIAHEQGLALPAVTATLPAGAMLVRLLDPHALCATLAVDDGGGDVGVRCTPATGGGAGTGGERVRGLARDANAPPTTPGDTATVGTALGALRVDGEHRTLPALLAGARRRTVLTGAGVVCLLGVMAFGTALVRRALREERDARALRDRFLANVSHDLKTPLTSLRLHAEMLGDPALDAAARARYADVVLAEGARMSALVEDLVDVSALQQGRRRIEPEPVDLAAAVRAHAAAWRPLFAREGIDVRLALAEPAHALADPIALGRILTNLLQNALRHGRPARDGTASWVELQAGPGPVVAVRDNGPGVPAALRERVFERWERAHATGDGLGLGLALARELAAACGGSLRCDDDGSTLFRCELRPLPAEDA
jgi:signal transduction histidine kinase